MDKLKEFKANLEACLLDAFTKDEAINRVVIEKFLRGQVVPNTNAVKQVEAFQAQVYKFFSNIPDIVQLEKDAESRGAFRFCIAELTSKLFGECIPFGNALKQALLTEYNAQVVVCGNDMTLLVNDKVYGGMHLSPNSSKYHRETVEMKQYLKLLQIISSL